MNKKPTNLELTYAEIAQDETREKEALDWAGVPFKDIDFETDW